MTVRFDHTIVFARDRRQSARFFHELFGVAEPEEAGMFLVVRLEDGVFVQFAEPGVDFVPQHYAFLVDDDTFARLLSHLRSRGIPHWADPRKARPGINHDHGGRGVYFEDPSGHGLEAITAPYA